MNPLQNCSSTSHALFCTSGAGSMISALKIFTTSSNLSLMSSYSTNERILLIRVQKSSLISSHCSTNFTITFGFCPGAGRIFSGTLAMPSKSVQFSRSVSTANIYGRKLRMLPHRTITSITVETACSRLYSLLSENTLSSYFIEMWPIS